VVLKVRVSPDLIAGDVDERYGKVADVFRRNMTSGQEVGAAEGDLVVEELLEGHRVQQPAAPSSKLLLNVASIWSAPHRLESGISIPSRPQGSVYLRLGDKVSITCSPGARPLISGTSAESCVSRLMTTEPWSSGCRAMTGISVGV
jgi:hypothetical protein